MDYYDIEPDVLVIVNDVQSTWKGRIIGLIEYSRTKVEVEDIDRGPGWSDKLQRYVGVKTPHGWYRGENIHFGETFIIHKDRLTVWNPETEDVTNN